jgi:TRAP-type mannitol/chloroaromatic compound transport system substrate-binding protein
VDRRDLLVAAATGLAGTALSAPAIAGATPKIKWRLVSSFPKTLTFLYGGADLISKHVAAMTDGNFQIQCFAAGEIVPGLMVLDAVQEGSVECGHGPSYFYVGKDPTFAFDTAIPFGLNTRQQSAWMQQGGGLELMRELFAAYNIHQIPAGNTGVQMGGWFRKEINGVDDLQGLKFRIPGLAGKVLAKLGVIPQQIAPGDVYSALEKGTIDAAEFVGPYDDEKLGLNKVAPHYYYPGWWEGCGVGSLFVNINHWTSLPKNYQAVLEAACAEASLWMLANYDAHNISALRRLVAAGALLRPFSKEIMDACYTAAFTLYDEIAEQNPRFKKVYDAWKPFREDVDLWFRIAEHSFDTFVYNKTAHS